MKLIPLPFDMAVCKLMEVSGLDSDMDFFFLAKTGQEVSLVCKTEDMPPGVSECETGWKGFYLEGKLDFSLIGILANIATVLAENGISIFALSTFDTDYILVKNRDFERALSVLSASGHIVLQD